MATVASVPAPQFLVDATTEARPALPRAIGCAVTVSGYHKLRYGPFVSHLPLLDGIRFDLQ